MRHLIVLLTFLTITLFARDHSGYEPKEDNTQKLHYDVYTNIQEIQEINNYNPDKFFSPYDEGFYYKPYQTNVEYAQLTNLMVLCVKESDKKDIPEGCFLARVDRDTDGKASQVVLFSKGISNIVFTSGNPKNKLSIKGGEVDLLSKTVSFNDIQEPSAKKSYHKPKSNKKTYSKKKHSKHPKHTKSRKSSLKKKRR
jgi:hypothetical protein|nr:MAG TPA: hypothetical protein [Caudoviricetes sp.]